MKTEKVIAVLWFIAGIVAFLTVLIFLVMLMLFEEITYYGKKMYVFFLARHQND